ncbi:MAG TPA: flavodoxin domain-containing protein, partial [Thermoleophilia bacterium]|nr:flavodoxin domain-containing protein [Thermoleophilia bacterium]
MRALVVYESMYGNTRAAATAVAEGLRISYQVDVLPVGAATAELVAEADLLVVGGPTHMHGLSRASSRKAAVEASRKPGGPELDSDAQGTGAREWLEALAIRERSAAAAFDTRMSGPQSLTGRAGVGIARRLRRRGYRLVTSPA